MASSPQDLDFDLALAPRGDRYRATVRSAMGEAAADVALPAEIPPPVDTAQARESGGRLFRAVFTGSVLELLATCLESGRNRDRNVRVRLLLDEAMELTGLPWESLYDSQLGRFLVQTEGLRLVRFSVQPPPQPLLVDGPLRLLVVIPQPSDWPPPAGEPSADALWQELRTALAGPVEAGRLVVDRLVPATQRALEQELDRTPTHLLHFLGAGDFRQRARYGKLVFENSQGRARPVSAELVGKLVVGHQALRLAVLSARAAAAGDPFLGLARDMVRGGLAAAVSLPVGGARFSAAGLAALFEALAAGGPVDLAIASAAGVLLDGQRPWVAPALFTSAASGELFARRAAAPAAAPPAEPAVAAALTVAEAPPAVPRKSAAQRLLEEKIERSAFDVFLSYRRADGRAVKEIGDRLKERGVLPWLDEWELRPGYSWQRLLEEQIERIGAAAVFVGKDGLGPWQRREMEAFLNEFVERHCPVIPVLLPDAPAQPKLPIFLKGLTWVDFRAREPDPLERLIWGVTGSKTGSH